MLDHVCSQYGGRTILPMTPNMTLGTFLPMTPSMTLDTSLLCEAYMYLWTSATALPAAHVFDSAGEMVHDRHHDDREHRHAEQCARGLVHARCAIMHGDLCMQAYQGPMHVHLQLA